MKKMKIYGDDSANYNWLWIILFISIAVVISTVITIFTSLLLIAWDKAVDNNASSESINSISDSSIQNLNSIQSLNSVTSQTTTDIQSQIQSLIDSINNLNSMVTQQYSDIYANIQNITNSDVERHNALLSVIMSNLNDNINQNNALENSISSINLILNNLSVQVVDLDLKYNVLIDEYKNNINGTVL